jgi:predicted PurR-regulated permease PerM
MATFNLTHFYQSNRRILIWVILIGLLWLLRDFFGLVFLTFVLAFSAGPLAEFGNQRLRLPYWLSLVTVYMLFLLMLFGFIRFVAPQVAGEATRLITNFPQMQQRMIEAKDRLIMRYPAMRQPFRAYLRSAMDDDAAQLVAAELSAERARLGLSEEAVAEAELTSEINTEALHRYHAREDELLIQALVAKQFARVRERTPGVINYLYKASATTLLALLFSFLILLDLRALTRQVKVLGSSRLRHFYEEAAQPVVRFAMLVGRAIQAQAAIACVNTALTAIGLSVLQVPSLAMLLLIVFVCSFVPVLGVFISTTPIVLVALNAGGLDLSALVIGMVVVIHFIEAYLLNPLIYGRHFKLNPVVTLIVLFLAHHAIGLWGLLLGVPIARYFIFDVFGVGLRGKRGERSKAEPATVSAD